MRTSYAEHDLHQIVHLYLDTKQCKYSMKCLEDRFPRRCPYNRGLPAVIQILRVVKTPLRMVDLLFCLSSPEDPIQNLLWIDIWLRYVSPLLVSAP